MLAALSLLGLGAVLTTAIFYIVLLGSDWLLYTALGITKPTQWSAADMVRAVSYTHLTLPTTPYV